MNSRSEILGNFIIDTGLTIRQTAKVFGYSKSLVHSDVSYKLRKVNYKLYLLVKGILKKNYSEKHIRGGQATKNKYKLMKRKSNR